MYKTIMAMGCDPEFGNSSRRPSFIDLQETMLRQAVRMDLERILKCSDDTIRYITYSHDVMNVTQNRKLLGLEPANYENARMVPEATRIIGVHQFWKEYEKGKQEVA